MAASCANSTLLTNQISRRTSKPVYLMINLSSLLEVLVIQIEIEEMTTIRNYNKTTLTVIDQAIVELKLAAPITPQYTTNKPK